MTSAVEAGPSVDRVGRDRMTDLPQVGAPATRALLGVGYGSLESLAGVSEEELLALHGFGPRAVRIINVALADAGLDGLAKGRP